jgi:hypothetical protein
MQTEYGAGTITVAYEDIEALSTDAPLLLVYEDGGEVSGRILGVERGMLLIGDDLLTAKRIDVRSIIDVDLPEELASWADQLRHRYRFWKANLNVGATIKKSTTDEFDIQIGIRVDRRKKPTRFVGELNYLVGREKEKGESTTVTDNELRGLLKGERDVSGKLFSYTSHEFERDEIDSLSLRWLGQAGFGYRIAETPRLTLQLESGLSYNLERYFGSEGREAFGIPFGTEGKITLPFDARLTFRTTYIPSIKAWVDDYLIITVAEFSIPITKYLALTLRAFETYDSTPDQDADNNELKTIVSLTWRF